MKRYLLLMSAVSLIVMSACASGSGSDNNEPDTEEEIQQEEEQELELAEEYEEPDHSEVPTSGPEPEELVDEHIKVYEKGDMKEYAYALGGSVKDIYVSEVEEYGAEEIDQSILEIYSELTGKTHKDFVKEEDGNFVTFKMRLEKVENEGWLDNIFYKFEKDDKGKWSTVDSGVMSEAVGRSEDKDPEKEGVDNNDEEAKG